MRHFVRENWIWIVAPILVFLAMLVLALALSSGGDSSGIYTIF